MGRRRWVWERLSDEGKVEKATLLSEGGNRITRPAHLPFTPEAVFNHLQGIEMLPQPEAYVIARICRESGLRTAKYVPGAGFTGRQIFGLCVLGVAGITVLFVLVLGWA